MSDWQNSKRWSDQFIPAIKRNIGEYLICEASIEEDAHHNTDLITLFTGPVRIACRIRTESYFYDERGYRDEFTIRCFRPSGNKTELDKILEGWGDYFFYGFGRDGGELIAWTLADLRPFRFWVQDMQRRFNCTKGRFQKNRDRSSDFRAYRWDEVPNETIVAQHMPVLLPW